ncbi:MAG: hypothetical protein HYR97_06160 [Candidatus Melainabacteria bacterium]|nr:hypothetical protein [Candidatus Melainabacteria bacterium]MBI3307941.1 hypothetical protein [Candidatus Melainabacteria bacterium]
MRRFNLKGILIISVIFFVFYGIYLFVTLKNKPKSAYSVLTSESEKTMLQDTRVHNWDELGEK